MWTNRYIRTADRDGAVLPDDSRVAGEAPRSRSDSAGVAAVVAGSGHVAVGEHPAVPQRVTVRRLLVPALARPVRRRVRPSAAVLGRFRRQATL